MDPVVLVYCHLASTLCQAMDSEPCKRSSGWALSPVPSDWAASQMITGHIFTEITLLPPRSTRCTSQGLLEYLSCCIHVWTRHRTEGVCACLVAQSCLFVTPRTVAHQAALSVCGNWSELPFPSPGDIPNPGIKPSSPTLAGRFFTTEPPRKPCVGVCAVGRKLGCRPASVLPGDIQSCEEPVLLSLHLPPPKSQASLPPSHLCQIFNTLSPQQPCHSSFFHPGQTPSWVRGCWCWC